MIVDMQWLLRKYAWYIGILLLSALGIACYFVLTSGKGSVTGQLLHQEQTIARAEASNIKSFFEHYGNAIVVESKLKSVEIPNENTILNLKSFVDQWGGNGKVAGITRTDKNGVVIYNVTASGVTQLGASLADRDYFKWAESESREGEYFIGQPILSTFGATKDEYIVPVAAPIFNNGVFSGVLVSAVRISVLIEHYLAPLGISDSTHVYLINNSGYIVYNGPTPKDIGLSVYEVNTGNPFSSSQKVKNEAQKALSRGLVGGLIADYADPENGLIQPHAIAYAPIIFPQRKWLAVLVTPAQTVTAASTPTYVRQIAIFFVITIVIFTIATVIAYRNKARGR